MAVDAAAELAACLTDAPGADAGAAEVKQWLWTGQNAVAVRLCRILEDHNARRVLREAAGRTWSAVTDAKGSARRLWGRLNGEFLRLAKSDAPALQDKANCDPWPPERTWGDVAMLLCKWTGERLSAKADLIFPWHGLRGIDALAVRWADLRHSGSFAVKLPPLGDFGGAMVMNRLGAAVWHAEHAARLAAGRKVAAEFAEWHHGLNEDLATVRGALWDAPDADERRGAMALAQVYLALEEHRPGFEADWAIIPWPAEPAELSLLIVERWEDADALKARKLDFWLWRHDALAYTMAQALKTRPGEVVRIVKDALTWFAGAVADAGDEPVKPRRRPGRPSGSGDTNRRLDGDIAGAWRNAYRRGKYSSKSAFAAALPGNLKTRIEKLVPKLKGDAKELARYVAAAIERHRKRGVGKPLSSGCIDSELC